MHMKKKGRGGARGAMQWKEGSKKRAFKNQVKKKKR